MPLPGVAEPAPGAADIRSPSPRRRETAVTEACGGTALRQLGHIAPFALAMGLLGATAPPPFAQATGDLAALRQEAIDLVNAARAEVGLPALGPSERLDRLAQDHAADMLERGYYDHVTPEGDSPFDRFLAAGGSGWALSGENIAACEGCTSPPDGTRVRAFHGGWMQSPGHRDNVLSGGFDSFGFGIAGEGGKIFAVQSFSGPGTDGSGTGEARPLTPEAARDLARERIDAARAEAGQGPLEPSNALDSVAERVLNRLADDPGTLPEDVFGLLPEGSTGWTSLALHAASLGGTGRSLTQGHVHAVVSDLVAASKSDGPPGGAAASHFGFAAEAAGNGRASAVAVFGGRE